MDTVPQFSPTGSWRDACLRLFVFFGVAVTIVTEGLGAVHLLHRGPLIVTWLLIALVGAWSGRRSIPELKVRWPGLLDSVLVAGVAAILLLVACTAILSPPNSADAMAYHLPRVVYWAQSGSVSFSPTHYYNQIMLQPLAEYIVLYTYILLGGDRYANLVQFAGFASSIIGVSLVAQLLRAGIRGQVIAAVFCATLPTGILQASGTKNDCLLAAWLVAMVYFALRFAQLWQRADLAAMGLSLSPALLTKGTAYLFAPAILLGVFLPVVWRERARLARSVPVVALCVLCLNGPQYWRNFFFSGSVLGYDSAQGDGLFRWRNERLGLRPTLSNLLRNVSAHLGARSAAWNQGVYDFVVGAHRRIGIHPNDPGTTWRWEQFQPPVNANHEASAPNRWHLLLLVASGLPLVKFRRRCQCYYFSVVLAFILFCFYLKWMPWVTRLHLPLFVLGSPVVGLLAERLLPVLLQAALCLFLMNNARPYVFENWTRPLTGPGAVWRTARQENYFSDMKPWNNRATYLRAVDLLRRSGCSRVGDRHKPISVGIPVAGTAR